MTASTPPRQYIITRSNIEETPITAKHSFAEAEQEAQGYADRHAEKVYIVWQSNDGATICQPVESRATAEYLETFAANDAETYESYFLPLARDIEKHWHWHKKHYSSAHASHMEQAIRWADFAVIRHDRMLAKVYAFPMRFTTDTKREAARDIIDYIVAELDAGNSWE